MTSSRRAQALGIGVVAIYLWSLMSMAFTAVGGTLLSFRLEPVLILLLGAAGVFGFFDFARWLVLATSENPRVKASVVVIGLVGLIAFAQNIPQVLSNDITVAYTDTDGDGARGDQRPPARPPTTATSTGRSSSGAPASAATRWCSRRTPASSASTRTTDSRR